MNAIVKSIFESFLFQEKKVQYNISQECYFNLKYHRINLLLNDVENFVISDCNKDDLLSEKIAVEHKNKRYLKEMYDLAEKLYKNSINFVFLKGGALILNKYRNLYSRKFSDVDILVEYEKISMVEDILRNMGYVPGHMRNGKIVEATREEIIFQKMHTHEIFNMVKLDNEIKNINIDVNFLFSWRGYNDNEKKYTIGNFLSNIKCVEKEYFCLPIFDNELQFVHLCTHFYNEAVFFLLDKEYVLGRDPKELLLFRLMDILLLIVDGVDIAKIVNFTNIMNNKNKIEYVLYIIYYIMGEKYVKDFLLYFDIDEKEIDCIYDEGGRVIKWPINLYQRLYDPESKIEALSYMLK